MQGKVVSKRAYAPKCTMELIQVPQKLRCRYLVLVPRALSDTITLQARTNAEFRHIRRSKDSTILIGRKKPQTGKKVPTLLSERNPRMRLARSTSKS